MRRSVLSEAVRHERTGEAHFLTKCGRQSLRNTSMSWVSRTTTSACRRVSPNHCEDLRLPKSAAR